jgi:SMC interacting uncharacterized protein involved in chromosome segregation
MTNTPITWEDLETMSTTHVHHHFYHPSEEIIIMKIAELLAVNESIKDQLNKAEVEIIAKIGALQTAVDELTAQLANQDLTPEQVASLTALQDVALSLDDIVPDPAPVESPAA